MGGHSGGGGRAGRGGGGSGEDIRVDAYDIQFGRGLSRQEERSLGTYSDGLSGEINNALITGENLDKYGKHIERIDSALEKNPLTRPVRVYRGVDHDIAEREFGKVGSVYNQKSFISTTDKAEIASRFSEKFDKNGRIHLMEITAKKGTPAVSMKDLSRYTLEREVLLGRNQKLRYTGKSYKTMDVHTNPDYYQHQYPLYYMDYGGEFIPKKMVIHKFEIV